MYRQMVPSLLHTTLLVVTTSVIFLVDEEEQVTALLYFRHNLPLVSYFMLKNMVTTGNICHMPYKDSVGLDQPAHLYSLI